MSNDHVFSRHVLNRPAWYALTGRQSPLALGDRHALRFAPEYGPFAAAADSSDNSLAALARLLGDGELWLLEREQVVLPLGVAVVRSAECLQMVASTITAGTNKFAYEVLGDDDAKDMLALATLTAPGPRGTGLLRVPYGGNL
jgi:hypothetical protein